MKKLALLLSMFFSPMALALNPAIGVHVINTVAIGTHPYTSPSLGTTAATGSSFLVGVGTNEATGCTVTDNKSNTYVAFTPGSGTNPVHETNDGSYLWMFLATNGAGGAGHTVTVTCADSIWSVDFLEIQNANTTTPIDVSAAAYSGTSPFSLPVTTTQANDLVVGVGYSAGGSSRAITFAGAGFTLLDSWADSISSLASGTLANATTGAHDPSYTRTGGVIAAMTVAFAPAGGGGGSCTSTAWVNGGTKAIPTASSSSVWLSTGAWGTTPCDGTGTSWWSTSGNFVKQ